MATQEAAQSVPPKFWHGRHSMVAPHLPVGSPEREELFARLRETFDEDWKAAEEAVERQKRIAKGDLYFVRCGNALKIGRTVSIVERLRTMQVNSPHEIDCLLLLRGRGHEEAKWHKAFAHCRIRSEWFKLTPDLERAVLEAREANMNKH